jgi:hypothetical protein
MNTRSAVIHHERAVAKSIWDKINDERFPHTRCTLKIVKLIFLLHDTDFNTLRGTQVVFKHKSLGAGVYDVWMEIKQ